jgi:hypothetical protein
MSSTSDGRGRGTGTFIDLYKCTAPSMTRQQLRYHLRSQQSLDQISRQSPKEWCHPLLLLAERVTMFTAEISSTTFGLLHPRPADYCSQVRAQTETMLLCLQSSSPIPFHRVNTFVVILVTEFRPRAAETLQHSFVSGRINYFVLTIRLAVLLPLSFTGRILLFF